MSEIDPIPNKKMRKSDPLDVDKICDTMMSRLAPHFKTFGEKINERITSEVQALRKEIEDIKKNPQAMQPAQTQQIDMKGMLSDVGKALGVDLSGLVGLAGGHQQGVASGPVIQPNGGGMMGNLIGLAEILKILGPQLGLVQQQNPAFQMMMEMMMRNQMAATYRSMTLGDLIMQKLAGNPDKLLKFMEVEKMLIKDPIEMAAAGLGGQSGQQNTGNPNP